MNLRLLAASLVIVALGMPFIYLWYEHRLGITASALLDRATQLEGERKWLESTSYYQRYLLIKPEDTDALMRMIAAYSQVAPTSAQVRQLTGMLYRAVGRAPERRDLRVLLAEKLLLMGDFAAAEKEADRLLSNSQDKAVSVEETIRLLDAQQDSESPQSNAANTVSAAAKVKALSQYLAVRGGGSGSISNVVTLLRAVGESLPADVQLATATAELLRAYPGAAPLSDTDSATEADRVMERLISIDRTNVQALLARYHYRMRYKLPLSEGDLNEILTLAPDDIECLLLAADFASVHEKDVDRTQELLRRAIATAPHDARAYLALSRSLVQANDREGAIKILRDGSRHAQANNIEINLLLVGMLIESDELDEAEQVLKGVNSQADELSSIVDARRRTHLNGHVRLLRARMHLARGQAYLAISELQDIAAQFAAGQAGTASSEWLQATALLATATGGLNQWDRSAQHWSNIASVIPHEASICQYAAAAYLKAGRPDAAREQIDRFALRHEVTPDMVVQLVQTHLYSQLSRPITDRQWAEFTAALATAKAKTKQRWELILAEVEYLLATSNDMHSRSSSSAVDSSSENTSRAISMLRASESQFVDQLAFWKDLAIAYQKLKQRDDMQRAIDRYMQLESSQINRAAFQAQMLANEGKFSEVDAYLSAQTTSLKGAEARQIQKLRARFLLAAEELSTAKELIGKLIDADPEDAEALIMGIELSLNTGDLDSAKQWEETLKAHEGHDSEWLYLRSLRMLLSYPELDLRGQQELEGLIAKLQSERSGWYPAVALAAEHARVTGDANQALSDFRLAIELGDQRPSTLEQLVSLLYQNGLYDEAQRYLSRLEKEHPESPLVGSLAIGMALKQNRPEDALDLAKQAAEEQPNDPTRRITLASLLLQSNQLEQAEKVFREAAQAFPEDARVWTGLLRLLVQTDQSKEARQTLEKLIDDKQMPQGTRNLLAAQGFEVLGEIEKAKQYYQLVIRNRPEQIDIRHRLAKLLSATDAVAARNEYEEVLRRDPDNSAARREMASLLAATGQEVDWNRAVMLLEGSRTGSGGNASTEDRLRAILLSRRGNTRDARLRNSQAAREILSGLIQNGDNKESAIDRKLMAGICEQEAALGDDDSLLLAAREQLRYLVDRPQPSIDDLTLYLDFLLRHGASKANDSAEDSRGEQELRDVFLSDAETRLEELRQAEARLALATDPPPSIAMEARLLHALGRADAAGELVTEYAARRARELPDESARAQVYLAAGNLSSAIGNHSAAEGWYRRLMKISPRGYLMVVQSLIHQGKLTEATRICLDRSNDAPKTEIAIVLARILTATTDNAQDIPGVLPVIESAIQSEGNNLALLEAAAAMFASRGENDKAIDLFRRLTEFDTANALALNNLATLLAERPNQRAEALDCINRAIAAVGRNPGLLDTQGTIYLQMGDDERAIACLEEATVGGASDPRYYYHLAAAYRLADRTDDARSALETSLRLGLKKSILTAGDREQLSLLEDALLTSVESK